MEQEHGARFIAGGGALQTDGTEPAEASSSGGPTSADSDRSDWREAKRAWEEADREALALGAFKNKLRYRYFRPGRSDSEAVA